MSQIKNTMGVKSFVPRIGTGVQVYNGVGRLDTSKTQEWKKGPDGRLQMAKKGEGEVVITT
jgi:hypothetical protein